MMTSPKITEGVMGVMKNPQNKAKNGCNECNDYIHMVIQLLSIRMKLKSFT